MNTHSKTFLVWVLSGFSLFILSCTSMKVAGPMSRLNLNAPELPKDPNEKSDKQPHPMKREIAADDPLITYCSSETATASTPEEKKWRDAFSVEVMERICNKQPLVAKPWRDSKYLESSWAFGLNLT